MPPLHRIASLFLCALLFSAAPAHATSPVVIDNTDAGFSVIGTWPASTTVTGYQGSNYQNHEANGSPPGAIVVDNADAGFSVTGTWPNSTAVGGYLGSNYQVHSANGEEPSAIVVDNLAGSFTGTWGVSTSVGGYYGTNYQAQAAGAGANSFTWTPTIATTGSYNVYARWTQHPNRSTHAVYTVNHAGGATAVTVNQEANGGTWQLLGNFTLNAGSGNTVVLSDQGDGYVIADAIKVSPDGAAPNTATWTPTIPTAGSYKVYARWTAHPNRATDAKYTVTHAGGDTVVAIDQEQNNGAWVLLGTFSMAPGAGHKVSLTDQANGYVIADAIQLLDTAAPEFNAATWTPNAAAGQYEVYAKWTANANRATNATYTITHAQGVTQVPVNQQLNGGVFNLLGTFNLNGSSTITLNDQANGYVIADAIQLIPLTTTPQMYFVHTDHLNTPRLIASDTGQAVWSWANDDPYGNNAPNENPSGAGNFTCNLRLPGQYFDAELNTHYNMARDYDPAIGRYVQSDPIGLQGGINTYAYVDNDPLTSDDPDGLQRRGGRPNTPYPNQQIANITANNLINQIQQLQPTFTYTYVTAPGQGGYTPAMIRSLQQTLLQLRQSSTQPPNFVVTSSGICLPVPQGSGLIPVVNPGGAITGQAFSGGTGGGIGLSPSVTQLRLMNPTLGNPTGYAVYMNSQVPPQGVNPSTGQVLPSTSPLRHIPK